MKNFIKIVFLGCMGVGLCSNVLMAVSSKEAIDTVGAAVKKISEATVKTVEFSGKMIIVGVTMNTKLPILKREFEKATDEKLSKFERTRIALEIVGHIQDAFKQMSKAIITGSELVAIFQEEKAKPVMQSAKLISAYSDLLKKIMEILQQLNQEEEQAGNAGHAFEGSQPAESADAFPEFSE